MVEKIQFALVVAVAVAVVLLAQSCDRHVRIPVSEYETVDSRDASKWLIKTRSNRTYWVTSFAVTDSTIVILKAKAVEIEGENGRLIRDSDLPITLFRDDVVALETVELRKARTAVFVGTLTAIVAFGVYFALGIGGLGSSN